MSTPKISQGTLLSDRIKYLQILLGVP